MAGLLGGAHLRGLGEGLAALYLDLLQDVQPHDRGRGWVLSVAAEERLARLCVALSWFEEVYRRGEIPRDSPLAQGVELSAEELLRVVPDYAVPDLGVQVRLAEAGLGQLRGSFPAKSCVAGPEFVGSAAVGGADGDLIIGRLLVDVKATSRPDRLRDEWIWQLAGYALLDFDDAFGLDEVGFYMSRIGWLKRWPIGEFFRLLGARQPVAQLRSDFAAVLDR